MKWWTVNTRLCVSDIMDELDIDLRDHGYDIELALELQMIRNVARIADALEAINETFTGSVKENKNEEG